MFSRHLFYEIQSRNGIIEVIYELGVKRVGVKKSSRDELTRFFPKLASSSRIRVMTQTRGLSNIICENIRQGPNVNVE